MIVQMTVLGPMFGQHVHFMRLRREERLGARPVPHASPPNTRATLGEWLGVVPFLGGQNYSIADIATCPWARGVGKPAEAKLMARVATINNRPAVTRALAAVDEVRVEDHGIRQGG
jgi:GST-like protein